ncbi:hypothetical protein C1H46_019310 [Malus baccata]|uniref:Uncharacterized protein n=1 Tax=Malus baccata TaxID=106549 RepID=A0A540M916_MALBA|nr:hypothetical protein C1H46_019310 [Malus baccata]
MEVLPRTSASFVSLLILCISLVALHCVLVGADISDATARQRDISKYRSLCDCEQCEDGTNIDIIATYSNNLGAMQSSRVKMGDLSASWVLENPVDGRQEHPKRFEMAEDSSQSGSTFEEKTQHPTDDHQSGEGELPYSRLSSMSPVKLKRRVMRQERRNLRTAELIGKDTEANNQMAAAAIERSKDFDPLARESTAYGGVALHCVLVGADISDATARQRDISKYRSLCDCEQCDDGTGEGASVIRVSTLPDEKNIDIIATYSNNLGAMQSSRVKMGDLSASWVLENPVDGRQEHPKRFEMAEDSSQSGSTFEEKTQHPTDDHQSGEGELPYSRLSSMSPVKLKRRVMRQERRNLRTAELIGKDTEANNQMAAAAIERSKDFDPLARESTAYGGVTMKAQILIQP